MKYNFFSSSSILRKFLVFNFIVFLVLGIFTFFYLKATKPNLVKKRSDEHSKIIKNTSDHINRLNIEFTKEGATKFLLSTRFLFQNLDRVQLYNLDFELLADTDTLDLAQDAFIKNEDVQETKIGNLDENIDEDQSLKTPQTKAFQTENYVKLYYQQNDIDNKNCVIPFLVKSIFNLLI